MSRIKAFQGISPNPLYAKNLISENTPVDKNLKSMLEPPDKSDPEAYSNPEVYRKIRFTLQNLLKEEYLLEETRPGIYIYEISQEGLRQTGVWAVTSRQDYTDGIIKTHELTLRAVETRLRMYREQVGLDGSPILLTYRPDEAVNRIITNTKNRGEADRIVHNHTIQHRLWKITDAHTIHELIRAFEQIKTVYLADGHHRLFAAVASATGKSNLFINSLYIASDQLKIREYDRLVIPEKEMTTEALLQKISPSFQVSYASGNQPVRPGRLHELGMYCKGSWYCLVFLPGNAAERDKPDATILQEKILEPVLEIKDPESDRRLQYFGGASGMQDLLGYLHKHPEALAFTLYPVTVDQLISVAGKGGVMPPKSTWIDPKVPYGLLMYRCL